MPYFYKNHPNRIILNGELEFDKTEHPQKIYESLCKTAEEVGGLVTKSRGAIGHGSTITVIPSYVNEYYVLNVFLDDPNDPKSPLRVASIDTWKHTENLDLKGK